MSERRWDIKMKILKLILLYNMVFILSFESKPSDPFGFIEGLSNFSVQLGETSLASNAPPAPASATPAAGGGGDCRSSHQAAGQSCDPEHVQRITATLASVAVIRCTCSGSQLCPAAW